MAKNKLHKSFNEDAHILVGYIISKEGKTEEGVLRMKKTLKSLAGRLTAMEQSIPREHKLKALKKQKQALKRQYAVIHSQILTVEQELAGIN